MGAGHKCKVVYTTRTTFKFHISLFKLRLVSAYQHTPLLLWWLSSPMTSFSTSCCPLGLESSAGSDLWTVTPSRTKVACTLTLKHPAVHVMVLIMQKNPSVNCIATYHNLLGRSHQTDGEHPHRRSQMSQSLLQRQKKTYLVISKFRGM